MLKLFKIIAVILSITLTPIPSWSTQQEPAGYSEAKIIYTSDLEVDVWVNRGEGAVYHPGDKIKVYFKTSDDCYLVIYGIDTKGNVNILSRIFSFSPADSLQSPVYGHICNPIVPLNSPYIYTTHPHERD